MRLSCGCEDYCKMNHGNTCPELAVHDLPCRLCQHYSPEGDRAGICRKNLMRVTAAMHVTYWRAPDAARGRHGLCFEAVRETTNAA